MQFTKAAIKAKDDRRATFVASNARIDSMGDTIDPKGWELADFKKNPVVLFAHDSRSLPVGKVTAVKVSGADLVADVEFLPEGLDEFADKVAAMVKAKFLNAVSVGFQALDMEPRFDKAGQFVGYNFLRQALRELSIVPVPANPDALAIARELNLNDSQKSLLFVSERQALTAMNRNKLKLARARAHLTDLYG